MNWWVEKEISKLMRKYFLSIHKWQYLIHLRCWQCLFINSTYSWRFLNVAFSGDQWRLVTFPLNEQTLYCIIYWCFICSMPRCPSIPISGQIAGFIDIKSSQTWLMIGIFYVWEWKSFCFGFPSVCIHVSDI